MKKLGFLSHVPIQGFPHEISPFEIVSTILAPQLQYKDDEKVRYKTRAKLSLPHKEPEEADCFVTEGHVLIEATPTKTTLSTTNLEAYLRLEVDNPTDQEFSICIPFAQLKTN